MVNRSAKDFGITCQILERLHLQSNKLWRRRKNLSGNDLNLETVKNYNFLTQIKRPITIGELKNVIRGNFGGRRLNIVASFYLPPLEDNSEFIPILSSLRSDLRNPLLDTRLYVEMYHFLGNEIELKGLGFRFERHRTGPKHDYWHIQIITKGSQNIPLSEGIDWIPVTVPCIPARAKCTVSLILFMLISFYGKGMYNKLFADMNIDNRYTELLEDIL